MVDRTEVRDGLRCLVFEDSEIGRFQIGHGGAAGAGNPRLNVHDTNIDFHRIGICRIAGQSRFFVGPIVSHGRIEPDIAVESTKIRVVRVTFDLMIKGIILVELIHARRDEQAVARVRSGSGPPSAFGVHH